MANKYGAKKTPRIVNGETYYFDSSAEAKRYDYLIVLLKAGHISNLSLQPEFILQDGFSHEGKKYRPVKYTADFKYIRDGCWHVEEVKGYKTEAYCIRKRLFLSKFGDKYKFIEITP